MMISRPMKAMQEPITDEQLKLLPYPVIGSPKLDGFWACCGNGQVWASSMMLIPNLFVRKELSDPALHGLVGELIVGAPNAGGGPDGTFHNTSGPIRRSAGQPNFTFYVFDNFNGPNLPYSHRWVNINPTMLERSHIKILEYAILNTPLGVIEYEHMCVAQGYEGAMIRTFSGMYKQGRTTLAEMNMFKRKPFEEQEGTIIGFEEQMQNNNIATVSNTGRTKRSKHAENLVPKGTLGAFIIEDKKNWKEPFRCSGSTADFNQEVWNHRSEWVGGKVKYKFQRYGSINKPRQAVFIDARPGWDVTSF